MAQGFRRIDVDLNEVSRRMNYGVDYSETTSHGIHVISEAQARIIESPKEDIESAWGELGLASDDYLGAMVVHCIAIEQELEEQRVRSEL